MNNLFQNGGTVRIHLRKMIACKIRESITLQKYYVKPEKRRQT